MYSKSVNLLNILYLQLASGVVTIFFSDSQSSFHIGMIHNVDPLNSCTLTSVVI